MLPVPLPPRTRPRISESGGHVIVRRSLGPWGAFRGSSATERMAKVGLAPLSSRGPLGRALGGVRERKRLISPLSLFLSLRTLPHIPLSHCVPSINIHKHRQNQTQPHHNIIQPSLMRCGANAALISTTHRKIQPTTHVTQNTGAGKLRHLEDNAGQHLNSSR
jgi:hypothetical protein